MNLTVGAFARGAGSMDHCAAQAAQWPGTSSNQVLQKIVKFCLLKISPELYAHFNHDFQTTIHYLKHFLPYPKRKYLLFQAHCLIAASNCQNLIEVIAGQGIAVCRFGDDYKARSIKFNHYHYHYHSSPASASPRDCTLSTNHIIANN